MKKYFMKLWFLFRHLSIVHSSFKYGCGLKFGYFNVIGKDVEVGDYCQICNFVLLKDETKLGHGCYIDSYVLSSGSCTIGNCVTLRYQSVIARNVIIKDHVFFTAGVKTIYLTQNRVPSIKPLTIEDGCYFGDNAVVMGAITIARNCIIGACAFVNKDTEPNGVYVGIPAKRLRDVSDIELTYMIN
jgi:UDP-2-acetamido-3-amino-2,3-dideoxy-glucuronate N-acetyltransferase